MDKNRDDMWRKYIKELRPMIAQLVNRYNFNKILSEDDIDDILQESILVLYEKTIDPTFNLTSKGSTYIYGVAENKIREKIRKNEKNPHISFDYESSIDLEMIEYDFIKDSKNNWRIRLIDKCIELLNTTQKKIFIEFYYHGKTMSEIAEYFNSNENSMKTQKYKATNNIKDCVSSKI